MLDHAGAGLWQRINNVAVMLFIAIDNRRDVKGFKMEIGEVEEAALAVCHGDRPKDRTRGQMPVAQTKTYSLLINMGLYCKEECDYTVDWMVSNKHWGS